MRKLVRMGRLSVSRGDEGEIRGWYLTPKERRLFAASGLDRDGTATSRAPSYATSYSHDTIVREVQQILKDSPAVQQWVPEHVLRSELMQRYYYLHGCDKSDKIAGLPDALIHLKSNGKDSVAALEVELTQKSKKRLLRKLESHILNPAFQFVFYVVEGIPLLNILRSVYAEVTEQSLRVKFSKRQNGIFFVDLAKLRSEKLDALLEGITDSFSLNDLAA